MRRARTLVAALAAVFAAAPAAGITAAPAQAQAPRGFVGMVAEDIFGLTGAARQEQLRAQSAAGVTLLRQTFDWEQIERSPGRYRFEYHDAYVLAAARAGIRIMPILFRPPSFHSSKPARATRRGTYPPRSNAAFGRFARALARRYGPKGSLWAADPSLRRFHIREWQVWNEPNLPVYWPGRPSAKGYVKMVAAVSRALKREHAGAQVVLAGIPDSRIDGAIPFERYVRGVFRAGGARTFDAFAVHPYAGSASGLLRRTKSVRRLLNRLPGGRRKRLWITEFGWASQGPGGPYTVGPERQARYTEQAIAGLYRRRGALRLDGFVLFNWRDASPFQGGKDFWGLHAGLLRIDASPKPALAAFTRATHRLGR